jgi:SSS family solute:Na+ symporter
MSTIASGLNSAGTLVSMDIVNKIRPATKDRSLLIIGRITILATIILAVSWAPLIAKFPSIFEAINDLLAVLSPPISAVLLWGVFSKRGTAKAGLYTLIFGFVLGVIAFAIDFEPIWGQRTITDVWGIHFMLKAFYLFSICTVFYFSVSAFTPKTDPGTLNNLTLKRPLAFLTEGKVKSVSDPRILAGILMVLMICLYTLFR